MSQQLMPISVRDTVLDLDDKINYAVFRSGQNISVQQYPANSQSSSQHVYAIQVPSTSTVVSRNVVWGSDITFNFTGTVAPYEYLVNMLPISQYNNNVLVVGGDCPAAFPLNKLCTNMSIQINNTTVSVPVNQVLDPLLRAVDRSEFEQWAGTTPTQLDKYADLLDCLPFDVKNAAALAAPVDELQQPFVGVMNSPLNPFNAAYCSGNIVSRNSFTLLKVEGNTPAGSVAAVRNVAITIRVREPLFVSPFLFGERDGAGLAGITQINITGNMDSLGRRAWQWYPSDTAGGSKTLTSVSFANSYVECKYYTPKPSDLIPATVVTPLATYTNYQLPPSNDLGTGASGKLTSNSIQLNSYPDKVFVWVDDNNKWGADGNLKLDYYATIEKVNITLNNQSGILSTFDITQLFRASVQSGSKQTWGEFSGLQSMGSNDGLTNIPTCGSVLMLNFGDVINIAQDYFAPGSLSTCQFQITVEFINNTNDAIKPQLNTMMMYSGILSTSNGSSSAYTSGVLTKENVLNAATRTDMNQHQLTRYVGGGLFDSIKSIASAALPVAKNLLGSIDNKYAKLAKQGLETFGYGKAKGGALAKKLM
jgi:hypothetical protein